MKFIAIIAAVSADMECWRNCYGKEGDEYYCHRKCDSMMNLNSRDAFGAIRTDIFNEDFDLDTLPERALTSRAAQNVYAQQNFLMQLDSDTDACWNKCVLYQPAHMCQYACNQQETFVPAALMNLKSLDDLVNDFGMEFDVDQWALMNLEDPREECYQECVADRCDEPTWDYILASSCCSKRCYHAWP